MWCTSILHQPRLHHAQKSRGDPLSACCQGPAMTMKKEELVKRLTDKGAKPPVSTPRSTPRRARSDPNVEAQTDAEAAVKKEAPAMLKQPSGIAKPGAMGKAPSLSKMPSGKLAKGQGVRGSANALKEVNAQ